MTCSLLFAVSSHWSPLSPASCFQPVFPVLQSFLNKASAGWMLNWDVQYLSRTEAVLRVSWDSLYVIHLM